MARERGEMRGLTRVADDSLAATIPYEHIGHDGRHGHSSHTRKRVVWRVLGVASPSGVGGGDMHQAIRDPRREKMLEWRHPGRRPWVLALRGGAVTRRAPKWLRAKEIRSWRRDVHSDVDDLVSGKIPNDSWMPF